MDLSGLPPVIYTANVEVIKGAGRMRRLPSTKVIINECPRRGLLSERGDYCPDVVNLGSPVTSAQMSAAAPRT